MVKPIITAHEVRAARQAGQTEMLLPPGAIVTPQARDDAGQFGIRLVAQASGSEAPCAAAPACAALPQPAAVPGRMTLYAGKPFME